MPSSPRTVSCGSSASTVPLPTTIASTIARSACTSARATVPVIHCELRSAAATRPSSVAAYFHVTNGRAVRTACSQGRSAPAAASSAAEPGDDLDAGLFEDGLPAGSFGVGVGDRVDDPRDAGVDQRLGARAGAAGVRARFEGDHHRRAARRVTGRGRGPRSRRAGRRPRVVAPSPTSVASGLEHDRADRRVRAGAAAHGLAEHERAAASPRARPRPDPCPVRAVPASDSSPRGRSRAGPRPPGRGCRRRRPRNLRRTRPRLPRPLLRSCRPRCRRRPR